VRSDAERLQDILEAIERIQSRAQIEQLQEDEMLQVWVLYHLQIVGEAVRSLSVELTQQHPEVPWSQIVGLRNRVVHEYFDIDLDIVIDIVTTDLPGFQSQIEGILQELNGGEP
jgi:uncharacterized protein with HEPN domain